MTRFGAGDLIPHREWQVLEEIVGSALTRMGPSLAGRAVTVDLPADLPLIAVDDVLIEQVLINLLENAARYTPEGSPVSVAARVASASAGPREVLVEMADSGPGLDPSDIDNVFERFYRGSSSAATRGVGLGLSVCRALVVAHGGWIDARNRSEGGAAFRFAIPLDAEPPGTIDDPAHSEVPPD